MLHRISVPDRSLTLILVLKLYVGTKWKVSISIMLQGNGAENDRLYAIILSENQSSSHESVKSGLNDVRRFLRGGEERFVGSET